MSSNMKKGLSLITSIAVAFVMCLGCMGVFADKAYAEEGDEPTVPEYADLIVQGPTGDPVNFYLDQNESSKHYNQLFSVGVDGIKYIENIHVGAYSAVNNMGHADYDNTQNVFGPAVLDILMAAGIDYSEFQGDHTITFSPADNEEGSHKFDVTFSWDELFGTERYAFPNAARDEDDFGAAVTDDEMDDMYDVPVVINLNDEADHQVAFGQVSPSERNKPSWPKKMLTKDKQVPQIIVDAASITPAQNPSKDKVSLPSGADAEFGASLDFGGTEDNSPYKGGFLYYTMDGSTPNQFSNIYNWDAYYKNKDGEYSEYRYSNITFDKPGEVKVKTRFFKYGSGRSEVQTFNYFVVADLWSGTVSAPAKSVVGTKPDVTVMVNENVLDSKYYRASYSGYKTVGEARVTVSGKDTDFVPGKQSTTFAVIPAKAAISKATAGKKKVTVVIKDQSKTGVKEYQISYKLSSAKNWKTVKTTKTKKVIKGLKSKKKYKIKVRALGPNGNGAFSSVKTVKIK